MDRRRQSNHLKRAAFIVGIYKAVKERDKPDTFIVRTVFPLHGIYISYRRWMDIKAMKPSEYQQPTDPAQLEMFS